MGSKLFCAFLILCLFSFTKGRILVYEECLNYTVYPLNYELNIFPHMQAGKSYYDCELTINVITRAPNMNVINLEAKDLDFVSGSIKVFDGPRNIINGARPFEYNDLTGQLHIYLKEPLKMFDESTKQSYDVKIAFRKYVKEDSKGLFLVKYHDKQNNGVKYLFTTRLSPSNAKYFFPCFPNPRFDSTFKFKVYIPKTYSYNSDKQSTYTSLVIAEEQKRESSSVDEEFTMVEYMPSPQVRLHQVGFHYWWSSDFTSRYVRTQNNYDVLILWAPTNELNDLKYIQDYGISIINLMHKYSNDDRPLLQGPINLIAVPTTNMQGYEIGSWNLLTNAAHRMVSIDKYTSINQEEEMKFELAQQLSRIWLGNPGEVEKTTWREEWFKEGMATYFAYYFMNQYNHGFQTPEKGPLGSFGLHMKHRAMAVDWQRNTPALETFNTSLAIEILPKYKELVTMKTGAILWMLENWLQSEKFHETLVNYIHFIKGNYISLQDFTTMLDDDTIECHHQFFNGSTASRILDSWFRRRGYPVINVQVLRDRTPNVVHLKQRQFSFTQKDHEYTDFLIPISYIVPNCSNCFRPRFTIAAQTYTFMENLNNGWIILNRQGSGYYRVNYDTMTWKLIAKALRENMESIDEMNRAQIVNDVFALYVAGDLHYNLALEILDYLDQECSLTVWEAVKAGYDLLFIDGASCNMTRHKYWKWENFMINKISSIFMQQVVKHKDGQEKGRRQKRLLRSKVVELACSLNYEPCHALVKRMYVEDRRLMHNLFPDYRMSYFYVLANETSGSGYTRKLHDIERDDKSIADKTMQERKLFVKKIPIFLQNEDVGSSGSFSLTKPDCPTEACSLEKLPVPKPVNPPEKGGASVKLPSIILFIAILLSTLSS